jgi:Xaa-Pro aminopeptidase
MGEGGADAVLVSAPANRRYLTGLTAHDSPSGSSVGWLLVARDSTTLVLGFLALEQARQETSGCELLQFTGPSPVATTAQLVKEHGIRRLACEGNHLTQLTYADLQAQLRSDCELMPVEGWVEGLRAVKDDAEVETIRRAARLTDRAFEHLLSVVRPGVTERELAWEVEQYMRRNGAEGMAFEVGLGSGVNTALPHASPTDKAIQAGEPIWIDMGARVDGYSADLTRSFCLGKPDEQLREVWDLVYRAQRAAIEGTRAGISGKRADSLARDIIAAEGHGDHFGHSLGHGVGLVVHESPRLSQASTDTLEPGMVATFEPGVYVPGWGGVRIEDLGVIREHGVELLSAASKFLEVD